MTSFRWVILVGALAGALGCGTDDGTADEPVAPGISGEALAGRLEVVVVDEDSREVLDRADVEVTTDGGTLSDEGVPGRVVFEDSRLTGEVSVTVRTAGAWARTTRWIGVAADRVVIPVARAANDRPLEGRLLGADTLGAARVVVGPLVTPHLTRPSTLDRAWPLDCIDDGAGVCRFSGVVPERASHVVATLRDGDGTAVAFGVSPLAARDESLDISMSDADTRAAAVRLQIAGPLPELPVGLDRVVGVPGLSTGSGIAFLPQTAAERELVVPERAGSIADATWWVFFEARAEDESARSVVLQRHLRTTDVGALPEFLAVPEVSVGAGGEIELTTVPERALVVIECGGPQGASTTLIVEPRRARIAEDCAGTVRISAVEALGASRSAFDLEAVERASVRFSERLFTR